MLRLVVLEVTSGVNKPKEHCKSTWPPSVRTRSLISLEDKKKMSDNIAVHSGEHLKYLLENSCIEAEGEGKRESGGDLHPANEPKGEGAAESPHHFDALRLDQGNNIDYKSHHDEDKDNYVNFINKGGTNSLPESKQVDDTIFKGNVDVSFDEDLTSNDFEKQHQKMLEDYNRIRNERDYGSVDILVVDQNSDRNEAEMVGKESDRLRSYDLPKKSEKSFLGSEENQFSGDGYLEESLLADADRSLTNSSSKLKAGFKYKEAEPRFIARNRIELGKRSQGSYSRKFLNGKAEDKTLGKREASLKVKAFDGRTNMEVDRNSYIDFDLLGGGNVSMQNPVLDSYPTASQGVFDGRFEEKSYQQRIDLKNIRENIEISRLEEMIQEEEKNLKNHIFDIASPQIAEWSVAKFPQNENFYPAETLQSQNFFQAVTDSNNRLSIQSLSQPRQEEIAKANNYAQIHSHYADKQTHQTPDMQKSYASQHLEKKNKPVSYRKYGLKDYKALNKEVTLQRSLGPDTSSDEYLKKVKD